MYHVYPPYPCPYYVNTPMYNPDTMYNAYNPYQYSYYVNTPMYNTDFSKQLTNPYMPLATEKECHDLIPIKDYGPEPFVVNIEKATTQNNTFRTALWTGKYLQLTLMSIPVGEDIGLEIHPDHDQFIRIEQGEGLAKMGDTKDTLDFQEKVYDDYAIFVPAGKWHNLINTGCKPLKLYSIYAPPEHPYGTVHATKAIAEAAEKSHNH